MGKAAKKKGKAGGKDRSGARARKRRRVEPHQRLSPWLWASVFSLGIVLGGGVGAALAMMGWHMDRLPLAAQGQQQATIEALIDRNDLLPPDEMETSAAARAPVVSPAPHTKASTTKLSETVDDVPAANAPASKAIDLIEADDRGAIASATAPFSPDTANHLNVPDPPSLPRLPLNNRPRDGQWNLVVSESAPPLWLKNSVAVSVPESQPAIAIVLDDVGVARANAELAIAMPSAVTLSFMTYADDVDAMARRARDAGHELMLHFPMQPYDDTLDTGPNALRVGLSRAELLRRLDWGLSRFDGYVGVNNHMGSRFTNDLQGMSVVLEELKKRGLLFLDSRTSANSLGGELASAIGLPHASRDVFLDNDVSAETIERQLREAERIALSRGDAVAIGHPHPETIAAIVKWMEEAKSKNIAVVPLSAIVRRRLGIAG